jgi:hypothetical protein
VVYCLRKLWEQEKCECYQDGVSGSDYEAEDFAKSSCWLKGHVLGFSVYRVLGRIMESV